MVNYKKKSGKKTKTTASKREKRTDTSTPPSTVSDHDRIPVVISLPPAVDGHLRCFLRVSVPTVHWTIHRYPTDVQVRLKWWGEDGDGVLFRPVDDKADIKATDYPRLTCVRYAVCSGPRQFNAYLNDMGALIFEVVHGPSLILLGQVRLENVPQLSASTPIQGFFDVMSTTGEKLAVLYIALRFESLSAAYSEISSSIPTIDMEMGPQRHAVDESDVQPTPSPLSLNPATPITHPRQTLAHNMDPFVSPAVKGVKFAPTSPERLEYTAEHSQIPTPRTDKKEVEKEIKGEIGDVEGTVRSALHSPLHGYQGANTSSDLIGALLHRGEKLREAMVMSADEENDVDEPVGMPSITESNSAPGKLFKAILTSDEPGVDDSVAIESVLVHNNKAVDLVLGEEQMHYLEESPDSSPDSSIVSESGDPLYDETLLKDLFYTTPAVQSDHTDSDNTVITDDEDNEESVTNASQEEKYNKVSVKVGHKQRSAQTMSKKPSTRTDQATRHVERTDDLNEVTSLGSLDPKHDSGSTDETNERHTDQHSPSDSLSLSTKSKLQSPDPCDFVENLGPEKLTALGRVDAARVMVDNLRISDRANNKPGTYFVEYNFPTSTPAHSREKDIAMATELTRIASKKIQDGVLLFNHRSVFPVLFNSAVIDYWWRLPLTFRLYFRESGQRMPVVIGVATFPLKTVLQSDTLSSSASLQIKHDLHSKHEESLSSSSLHHTATDSHDSTASCGPLLVKIELMTDGKQLHIKANTHRKPPLPTTTTPTKTTDHVQVIKPAHPVIKNLGQVFNVAPHGTSNTVNQSGKLLAHEANKFDTATEHDKEPLTLYNLLWIPEGKELIEHSNQGVTPGLVSKSNLYLVCRMFWCEEVSKSRVCWGATNPLFGFKQVAPVLLSSTLLQRVCNNFMVVEVWNRIGPHDQGDKLLGLVKLPLHQLYLSYRDPKITRTLLKSQYPVVAVDQWCPVTNPFTHTEHGHLRVLLAMGLEQQIAAILSIKCGQEIPAGIEPRPDHHLDSQRQRSENAAGELAQFSGNENQEFVEHQFEIVIEDIRGLSVFGSTLWGETDCFVQYHFPFQRHLESDSNEGIPHLQPHRTPTTLCVPEPVFHDVARHTLKLPHGFPVQKHLLAAFTGSWVTAPSIPGSGGVPFEVWRRYYYPNIRDQMVAKASLPLAKLCAMVTMQKQGEANVQTFSLPLNVLAGDAMDGMRQDRVQDTGLLDVTVKYQQVKAGQAAQEDDKHVCLSLEVFQACGLKAAALSLAQSNPSLSYPAEVGVNAYIVIQFPLGKKHKHVTRTVARTFSPEFSYNADILLPLVMPSGVSAGSKRNLSLAEQLEESEMLFEVWHQMSRGMGGEQVTRSGTEVKTARQRDVLLGVGRVPLIKLLAHKTGVKGWFPIYLPCESDMHDADHDDVDKIVGGLELGISFSEGEDRDHVIHLSRGVGWSPPPGIDCDEDWMDREDLSQNKHWKFGLKINKAWIPSTELQSLNMPGKKLDKTVRAYARYKLYNKAPICSRVSSVKDSGDGKLLCELRHSKDVVLQASPSLAWHMTEECLEVQLWLSNIRQTEGKNSRKRDRLVGSAFVDVSSLFGQQRKQKQISGLFPLFRSGANNLSGACIHVQASLHMSSENTSDHEFDVEQHLSSDESVGVSTTVEDHVIDSSQDHTPSVKSTTQQESNRQLSVTDDNTFMAHVIIEQALHLPTVPGDNDARLMPNVYVSYQTLASMPVACTPVVMSLCNPKWEYQKLERISYTALKSQDLVFKVWHTSQVHDDKGAHTKAPESVRERDDSSGSEDRVIGFVPLDLSPLSAGMRQLIGWYNVTDFNGECQGQIKLGVSPVNPVSPPRCLRVSKTTQDYLPKQDAAVVTPFLISPGTDGSGGRLQIDEALPSLQLEEHHEVYLTGPKPHSHHGDVRQQADREIEALPVCSTSLLFSQLRHNMKELDALQQSLNVRLRSSNQRSGDRDIEEHPSVMVASPPPLNGIASTEGTRVDGREHMSPRTDLEKSGHMCVAMPHGGNETSAVPNDEHKLASLISPLEVEYVHDDKLQTTERTIDSVLDKRAGTLNSKGMFPFDKGKDENPLNDTAEDSFFSVEKQKSLSKDRRPSVDSELSFSDISGDLSASGYVQNNTKSSRFADLKDSWLSSEDEDNADTFMSQSVKPGLSNVPLVNEDSASDTNSHCHGIDNQDGNHDADSAEDDNNSDKGCHVMQSQDNGDHSSEDDIESNNVDAVFTTRQVTVGSLSETEDDKVIVSDESDHENEPNSYSSYKEFPKQASWSTYPTSHLHTSTSMLPNFFMPSEQLEQYMRELRMGTGSNNSSHSKLLARSSGQQTKGNLTEKFAKRQPVYKARNDGRPPISNSEVDRIAKIFSFNSGGAP